MRFVFQHQDKEDQMFSRETETKIAVLEERLTSYEAMLKKIDEAIQLLGQTSQNISKMLAVHEEKLDSTVKNEDIIIKKIKDIEEKNTQEHIKVLEKFMSLENKIEDKINTRQKEIDKKIEDIEEEINDINKTRFMAIGMATITAIVVTVISQLAGGIIKMEEKNMNMNRIDKNIVHPAP